MEKEEVNQQILKSCENVMFTILNNVALSQHFMKKVQLLTQFLSLFSHRQKFLN